MTNEIPVFLYISQESQNIFIFIKYDPSVLATRWDKARFAVFFLTD